MQGAQVQIAGACPRLSVVPPAHRRVPSVRSRRAYCFEHGNRDAFAGADVIAVDERAAIIAQSDRLGAQREGALLAGLDKKQTGSCLRARSPRHPPHR